MRKNPNLKKANQQIEYTQETVHELLKCSQNPTYFIENYVKVQHPVRGMIPFALYPYQKRLVKNYHNNRLNIVLSARQTGKCLESTTSIVVVNKSDITTIKKIILWIFNRKLYNDLFKDNKQK